MKWYVFDKNGDVKYGPYDDKEDAETKLGKIRDKMTGAYIDSINESIMFENLGNLKAVELGLIDAFKDEKKYQIQRGSKFHYKSANTLAKGLGQNSPIRTEIIRSGKAALDRILGQTSAKGAVLMIEQRNKRNGISAQLLSFATAPRGRISEPNKFNITLSIKEIKEVFGDEGKEVLKLLGSKFQAVYGMDSSDFFTLRNEKENIMYMVLTKLLKLIKTKDFEPVFLVIHTDEDRAKTATQRAQDRQGMEIKPSTAKVDASEWESTGKDPRDPTKKWINKFEQDYNKYVKSLRSAYSTRLRDYKNSKQDNVTVDDMLKVISEKGFIDKIKINGVVYSKDSNSIYLDDLKKGTAKVEYHARSHDNSELLDKLQMQWLETRKRMKADLDAGKMTQAQYDDSYHDFRQSYPPGRLFVILKADGGTITPEKITVSDSTIY